MQKLFGEYEQDGNDSNGKEPLEWTCIEKEDGKILLLCNYATQYDYYNKRNIEIMDNAFSSAQQQIIQVKLLSASDVEAYIINNPKINNSILKCKLTKSLAKLNSATFSGSLCEWWLQSGINSNYVDLNGSIQHKTNDYDLKKRGYRSAIWVSID